MKYRYQQKLQTGVDNDETLEIIATGTIYLSYAA
jgi:hypothetical protein